MDPIYLNSYQNKKFNFKVYLIIFVRRSLDLNLQLQN